MTIAWIPALAAIALSGFGGTPQDTDTQSSMRKLDFLVGNWEGDGWMMMGPNDRIDVNVTMKAESKINGGAIVYEGTFTDKDGNRVAARSLGLITYRPSKSSFMGHMVYSNRPEGDYVVKVEPQGFSWSVELEHGATVTYRMNKNIEGNWHEMTTYAFEGSEPVTVMEFTLRPSKTDK